MQGRPIACKPEGLHLQVDAVLNLLPEECDELQITGTVSRLLILLMGGGTQHKLFTIVSEIYNRARWQNQWVTISAKLLRHIYHTIDSTLVDLNLQTHFDLYGNMSTLAQGCDLVECIVLNLYDEYLQKELPTAEWHSGLFCLLANMFLDVTFLEGNTICHILEAMLSTEVLFHESNFNCFIDFILAIGYRLEISTFDPDIVDRFKKTLQKLQQRTDEGSVRQRATILGVFEIRRNNWSSAGLAVR
ncbi:hypothetical protein BDV96DRAFT_639668 [Lophiotrema nucula]|uniref:Uncharacterized protein n=1 Tax=Lophiotrema nucula TaxID=690887 RepID=A0A6A5ZXT8_9PLEO|nr:hypothetical protein BDV96DRAFT_639668 [Lophiotrema nucula]